MPINKLKLNVHAQAQSVANNNVESNLNEYEGIFDRNREVVHQYRHYHKHGLALINAASTNNLEEMQELLTHPHILIFRTHKIHALCTAATLGHYQAVQQLLMLESPGFNAHALDYAVETNNPRAVEALLNYQNGADISLNAIDSASVKAFNKNYHEISAILRAKSISMKSARLNNAEAQLLLAYADAGRFSDVERLLSTTTIDVLERALHIATDTERENLLIAMQALSNEDRVLGALDAAERCFIATIEFLLPLIEIDFEFIRDLVYQWDDNEVVLYTALIDFAKTWLTHEEKLDMLYNLTISNFRAWVQYMDLTPSMRDLFELVYFEDVFTEDRLLVLLDTYNADEMLIFAAQNQMVEAVKCILAAKKRSYDVIGKSLIANAFGEDSRPKIDVQMALLSHFSQAPATVVRDVFTQCMEHNFPSLLPYLIASNQISNNEKAILIRMSVSINQSIYADCANLWLSACQNEQSMSDAINKIMDLAVSCNLHGFIPFLETFVMHVHPTSDFMPAIVFANRRAAEHDDHSYMHLCTHAQESERPRHPESWQFMNLDERLVNDNDEASVGDAVHVDEVEPHTQEKRRRKHSPR